MVEILVGRSDTGGCCHGDQIAQSPLLCVNVNRVQARSLADSKIQKGCLLIPMLNLPVHRTQAEGTKRTDHFPYTTTTTLCRRQSVFTAFYHPDETAEELDCDLGTREHSNASDAPRKPQNFQLSAQ